MMSYFWEKHFHIFLGFAIIHTIHSEESYKCKHSIVVWSLNLVLLSKQIRWVIRRESGEAEQSFFPTNVNLYE